MKDLCVKEVYTKEGVEHTSWNKVGVLIETTKGSFIKLGMFPNMIINIFEQKQKNNVKQDSVKTNDEINTIPAEDIPF